MTLEYNENQHWKALLPILEDHTEWFHSLVKCFFYPEDVNLLCATKKPTSFAQWFVQANRLEEGMQPEIIEKLAALHADLFKVADDLVYATKESGVKPSQHDFEKFLTIYEEFLLYIRRLERDILSESGGYDALTGLRSKSFLIEDIERELHRLARQGKNFCIALVKLDNFNFMQETLSQDECDGYIKLVAGLIKLSVRSFDDAYYMGKDEFLLSLKQADVSGGVAALERLRKELEGQDVTLRMADDSRAPLSMSCCIAEPVASDDVHDLIKNLRADLSCSKREKTDTVLEYHELSPLQRYVQSDH